jgi:hypothetical protein
MLPSATAWVSHKCCYSRLTDSAWHRTVLRPHRTAHLTPRQRHGNPVQLSVHLLAHLSSCAMRMHQHCQQPAMLLFILPPGASSHRRHLCGHGHRALAGLQVQELQLAGTAAHTGRRSARRTGSAKHGRCLYSSPCDVSHVAWRSTKAMLQCVYLPASSHFSRRCL